MSVFRISCLRAVAACALVAVVLVVFAADDGWSGNGKKKRRAVDTATTAATSSTAATSAPAVTTSSPSSTTRQYHMRETRVVADKFLGKLNKEGKPYAPAKMDAATDMAAGAVSARDEILKVFANNKADVANDQKLREAVIATLRDKKKNLKDSKALAAVDTMIEMVENFDTNDAKSNKDFSKFFKSLEDAGHLLPSSGEGSRSAIREVPRSNFRSANGRMRQLAGEMSDILYFHTDLAKRSGARQISEVQTMFLGDDIYIATNHEEGLKVLQSLIEDHPKGLAGLLSDLPPGYSDNPSTNSFLNPVKHDEATRVARSHNKLTQLFNQSKEGQSETEYSAVNRVIKAIKDIGTSAGQVVDVDFASWDQRSDRPDVKNWTPPAGKARLIFVRNKVLKGQDPSFDAHAETGLAHVLAYIHAKAPAVAAKGAIIAGKKRACMTCAAALLKALGDGIKLDYSLHSGNVWKSQTALHDRRTNLVAALLALKQPTFVEIEEPSPGQERSRERYVEVKKKRVLRSAAVEKFGEDSESADYVNSQPAKKPRKTPVSTNNNDDDGDTDDNDSAAASDDGTDSDDGTESADQDDASDDSEPANSSPSAGNRDSKKRKGRGKGN